MIDQFKREQRKLLKEQKLLREKALMKARNKSLELEVKQKSKELANSAFVLSKQKDELEELKNELISIKADPSNDAGIKKILNRIDRSFKKKGEWEVFENNFNQVHEKFFSELKKNHPTLKARDLKLCAYIRMNLLTKEIAPLMGISNRGIETHRYRLKRKLNLESNTSLTDYLMQFED